MHKLYRTNLVTDLRDFSGNTSNFSSVFVTGDLTEINKDGGIFVWDAASIATDNSTTIIKPDAVSGAGRWIRATYNIPSIDAVLNAGNTTALSAFLGDLTVQNLTVAGNTTTVNSTVVQIADNILTLNYGETGPGVTNNPAGIEVDRGTLTDYQFVFDEITDTFRIGEIGSLQPVATREDTPINGGLAVWDNTTNKFITVPTSSLSGDFVTLATAQTITGAKTFQGGIVALGTASILPSIVLNANGAANNNEFIDFKVADVSKFQVGYTQVSGNNRLFIYNPTIPQEVLTILETNGNVGIGISPTEKLHVAGNVRADNIYAYNELKVRSSDFVSGTTGTTITLGTTANYGRILASKLGDTVVTDIVMQEFGGNVGIGVTPTEKLHVGGNIKLTGTTAGQWLRVGFGNYYNTDTNAAIEGGDINTNFSGFLRFMTMTFNSGVLTEKMLLTHDGNLGIGITPTEKLHVAGNIRTDNGNYISNYARALDGVSFANANFTANSDGAYPVIGFHRVGVSGVALYHVNLSPDNLLRLRDSSNVDYTVWHSGNSNLSTVDWNARFLISGNGKWLTYGEAGGVGVNNYGVFNTDLSVDAITILRSNNNVGIGTASPQAKLDVNGSIYGNYELICYKQGTVSNNADAQWIELIYDGAISGIGIGGKGTNAAFVPIQIFGYNGTTIKTYATFEDGLTTLNSTLKMPALSAPSAESGFAKIWAETISSTTEIRVMDSAGNITTISPHNASMIPASEIIDDMSWYYYSERDGKRINVNMYKAIKDLEELTGNKYIYQD